MSARSRVAIVGGGAAAVGVLKALEVFRDEVEVTLYDLPSGRQSPYSPAVPAGEEDSIVNLEDDPQFIQFLRSNLGLKFPPPKSDFGIPPPKLTVQGWGELVSTETAGGLTRFWGASALPYPDREFDRWPFPAKVMRPHYEAIVESMPVSGDDDDLSKLWGDGLSSRPALPRSALFSKLLDRVKQQQANSLCGYDLVGGGGRIAVETDESAPNHCRQIGSCMSGCPRHSIFKAATVINAKRDTGQIHHSIDSEVQAFNPADRTLIVKTATGHWKSEPFDVIFLAAGCINSTTIALRSLAIDSAVVQDNRIVTFPILRLDSSRLTREDGNNFSLTNLVVACLPRNGERASVIQMYPVFDLLWKYFSPSWMWPYVQSIGRFVRTRGVIARLYLPPEHSQSYQLTIGARELPILTLKNPPTRLNAVPHLWRDIRHGLSGGGFWVPRFPAMAHSTSSHYGGTLPLGSAHCDARGQLAPGVFLCDSSAFPASSAFSPTLTIMAYAHRTATLALQEHRSKAVQS